jgi:putative transposase
MLVRHSVVNDDTVGTQNFIGTQNIVGTQNIASLPKNKFGPQSQNLASIIRGFKIGITKYARLNRIDFYWQSRYHDHIIRNETEL